MTLHISCRIASFQFLCTRRLVLSFTIETHCRSVICSTNLINKLKLIFCAVCIRFCVCFLQKENYPCCVGHDYHKNINTVVLCVLPVQVFFRFTTGGLIFLRLPPEEFTTLILLVSVWSPKFTWTRECCFLESKWKFRFRSPVLMIQFVLYFSFIFLLRYWAFKTQVWI